jgi:hypothetical protein
VHKVLKVFKVFKEPQVLLGHRVFRGLQGHKVLKVSKEDKGPKETMDQ